jgi:cytochrome c oxidase assembly protein subunit 15
MPFDVRDFEGAPPGERAASSRNRRLVASWLFVICGMILVMTVLGGVTRLTGSGLSIMEWAPLSGILPPLSHAEWEKLFALYQQIPQYRLEHAGFGLAGFQRIFWLEWVHRLWGRLIGIAFFLPLVWFWAAGRIERRLRPRLALIFLLGGVQGAVGWFMVESGFFPDSIAVSPYRLAIHLALALVLYTALLWTALGLVQPNRRAGAAGAPLRVLLRLCCALVALTIVAGSFVAGTHAGLEYNTFPLMEGRLIPINYERLTPFLRNLTDNPAAVQFDHRLLATLTAVITVFTVIFASITRVPPIARAATVVLGGLVVLQYSLGIGTLLLAVPVPLAAAHQACAVLVLTASLVALHALRPLPARHTSRLRPALAE